MPVFNNFVLLTAEDTYHKNAPLLETNCACPTDGFILSPPEEAVKETDYYQASLLHTDAVGNGFHLAFNPQGDTGVVVLNEAALNLTQPFRQPCTLVAGLQAVGNPPGGLETVQQLVRLNLLQPPGSFKKPKQPAPETLTAWLHVTNECNLRCPYCFVHKTPDDMELERGRQAVAAVFRSAMAHGFQRVKLKYAGGEATLNFHTVLILHDYATGLAQERGMELAGVVLSNGVSLSNRMIDEMKTRGIQLMISLDGVGHYHDAQRHFINGHGSFAHVERTLDRLAARDFIPSISITLTDRNLDGLPEVVAYVLERGLPFTLNFYRENVCSAPFTDLAYGEERIIQAMKEAFAVIEANLPPFSLLGALLDRARLDAPHDRPCGVGDNYLVINHKGGIAKCQMEVEQTVTNITADDPLQLIRDDQIGIQNVSVQQKVECRECLWRYWCAGGCPALTYRMTGRYDLKSPNCRIYKALFPLVLRLEALRLITHCSISSPLLYRIS